ncbi:MAG: hypothetical protein GY705_04430 [Bacteroidetes bacterium]|nr:hypothetical protein [Bacteroidota bacterium]
MKYPQFIRILFFLFSVTLFFQACRTEPKDQQTEVAFKKVDNTVTIVQKAEPDRLNPILTTSGYASQIHRHLFLTLLTFDPQSLELSPVLAKALPQVGLAHEGSWSGKPTYTFEIREEARWDNGNPVLASDYAFTMKALFNPRVGSEIYRAALDFIADVQIDSENPRKFTVFTSRNHLNAMYETGFFVYPEYAYDPEGLLREISLSDLTNTEKAGQLAESNNKLQQFADAFNDVKYSREKEYISACGPYQLEEWTTGQRIVLTKKENWWGDALAKQIPSFSAFPEKLIYRPVTDEVSALTLLKNEDVDVMAAISDQNFIELEKNELVTSTFKLHRTPVLSFGYLGLNTSGPVLEDNKVRQALAHAIDVDEMLTTLKHGFAQRVIGPIPPSKPYYNSNLQPIPYNPEKARNLLEEAGWSDSNGNGIYDKEIEGELTDLILTIQTIANSEAIRNIALLVQNTAKKAGIQIETAPVELNMARDNIRKGNFEMFILSASRDLAFEDPYQFWHTESAGNYSRFGNAESDALIEEIRSTTEVAKRNELYIELQELLYEEQPFIFLYTPLQGIAIHKRFANADPTVARPGFFENYFKLDLGD